MTNRTISGINSWNLHQLEELLAGNAKKLKQTKTAIHTACLWAEYFDQPSNQYVHRPLRSLEASLQVMHIAVADMSLDLSTGIAALLAPSFLANQTPLESITQYFGKKTACILAEIDKFTNLTIDGNTIDSYLQHANGITPSTSAVLLHICDILQLHCHATAFKHPKESLIINDQSILFELQYFYIPLVHKLRLYDVQTRLADFWLKYADTINYYAITAQLGITKLQRQKKLDFITEEVHSIMQKCAIRCVIKKRIKSLYAIWHKMHKLRVDVNQIHDLTAIRIIAISASKLPPAEEKILCWKIFSILLESYKPLYKLMRDWISTPKENGYESLHLVFETEKFDQLEIQIRTERMDNIAEHGEAAHWKYKRRCCI